MFTLFTSFASVTIVTGAPFITPSFVKETASKAKWKVNTDITAYEGNKFQITVKFKMHQLVIFGLLFSGELSRILSNVRLLFR